MRTSPLIQQIWSDGGPFIGEFKPNTVVTVQAPWSTSDPNVRDGDEDHVIHPTITKIGNYRQRGIPLRWYQKADASQTETLVPNVESVSIDRSIDTDAGTCSITLYNQWMRNNGDPAAAGSTELGIHGYFTPQHGQSPEAQARWGHATNAWEDVLVPNAVLRTYQGFGGHDKTLALALADGNLLLTGIWLVDEVRIKTDGKLQIEARDVAKLLIEQQLYPPLVPVEKYPLKYFRYVRENRQIAAAARTETITTTTNVAPGDKRTVFIDSGVDRWYPSGSVGSAIPSGGFLLHGHRAVDCLDGNTATYCLSVGNSDPSRPFCLSGDTVVITRDHGRVPIAELAGSDATVLTQVGSAPKWVNAPVRSFGLQPTREVTLERYGKRRTVRATPHHRWIVAGERVLTMDLRPGDRLATILPPKAAGKGGNAPSPIGIMAGVVYGDGSRMRSGSRVQLYGDSMALAKYFDGNASIATRCTKASTRGVRTQEQDYLDVQGLPGYFKAAPPLNESTSYLFGWLAGYFAADGAVSLSGEARLVSRDRDSILLAQRVADIVGIATHDIRESEDPQGPRFELAFIPETVPEGFFLLSKHSDRWVTSKRRGVSSRLQWRVVEVSDEERIEEVFCATVPTTHSFALDGWILTGNCTDWWEFDCGEWMNAVYMHPWGGNYTMYISVMENGAWQGTQTVPYDPSSLFGSQPYAVNTGANIPYVAQFGTPWETGQEYILPRLYNAQRVRVSFRNHTRSEWGPWYYRCGMREFRVRASNNAGQLSSSSTVTTQPLFLAGDALRDPTDQNRTGYVTLSTFWQIDAFGDCRIFPVTTGPTATQADAVGIALNRLGDGYWVVDNDGVVSAFGAAVHYGEPKTDGFVSNPSRRIVDITATHTGNGYWVLASTGAIYSYGDAADYTNPTASGQSFFFAIEGHPTGMGYWVMDTNGVVTARGAATSYGNFSETALNHSADPGNTSPAAVNIRSTYSGNGYWILTDAGVVQGLGAAGDYGQIITPGDVNDFYASYYELFPSPANTGYLIMKGDGTITIGPGGAVEFFGAPIPGQQGQIRKDGNYKDYTDIVKDLVLWSGFLLFDPDIAANEDPGIYGALESTGAFSETPLPDDLFDKRPVIDALTELKETVGYLLFVDDEGRIRFESPNWWSQGNFDESGEQVAYIPEIDERVNLTDYSVSLNDENLRSLIIIASEDPDAQGTSTIATKLVPQTAQGLKGLLVPAMWINGFFRNPDEQKLMAELISLHIWFQQRIGQTTCVANPCIQINDQVRISERTTSETYIHYVRGISSTHNLETGEYTMTLTTHWVGDADNWAITADSSFADDPTRFVASPIITGWLRNLPSKATKNFGATPDDSTWFTIDGDPSGQAGQGPTEGL